MEFVKNDRQKDRFQMAVSIPIVSKQAISFLLLALVKALFNKDRDSDWLAFHYWRGVVVGSLWQCGRKQ